MDMQGLLAAREGQSRPGPSPGRQAAVRVGMELVRNVHYDLSVPASFPVQPGQALRAPGRES